MHTSELKTGIQNYVANIPKQTVPKYPGRVDCSLLYIY